MYSRNGNPLFIPETRGDAANAFYAIGQLNAQMFSPFGIERQVGQDSPLARAYDVLGQLTGLIMEHQNKGTMKAVMMEPGTGSQKVQLGNYMFDLAMGRGWGAAATPMASLAAVEEGKFENGAWVVGRHLAGDDTGMGGDDRASLRLTANPGILRVSLYSYR